MIFKDIKEFTKNWKAAIKETVSKMKRNPKLAIIQIGNHEASSRYVKNKVKDCEEVGIYVKVFQLNEDISQEHLIVFVQEAQAMHDGIIIQLPLPPHINIEEVKKYILPEKDIDGFLPNSKYVSCTPGGIMRYLEYCEWDPEGKNVVVIGRSEIVGKPMARLLTEANATVTLCHSKTKNIWEFIDKADLVICAVGKKDFLDCSKINCPVIDVGINFMEAQPKNLLVGDCYNTTGKDVTPVPGGVGLLTRCMLLENIIQ